MVKHYTLTLPANAVQLSTLLTQDTTLDPAARAAAADLPFRELTLSGETGNNAAGIKIGGDNTVSATVYGLVVPNTTATLKIGPFDTGPVKLSKLWAFAGAANDKLHILGIVY